MVIHVPWWSGDFPQGWHDSLAHRWHKIIIRFWEAELAMLAWESSLPDSNAYLRNEDLHVWLAEEDAAGEGCPPDVD